MNASEKPRRFGVRTISSEALVGIGITIAELGGLCLLLGWAEYMRSVRKIALIWAALGVLLVIVGGLIAIAPRFKDRRRIQADRLQSVVPADQTPRVRDPEEEQLY